MTTSAERLSETAKVPVSQPFAEKSIDVARRRVRFLEGGEGPPLVMVHGGGGLRTEPGVAQAGLAEHYRVLALELPGWGGSRADHIASMHDLADVVAGFAAALELDRYALLGTSFGGAVALWTAIQHPEQIEALVLEAPAAFRAGVPGPGEIPPFTPDGRPIPRPDPAQVAYIERVSGPATDPDLVEQMSRCAVPSLVLLGTSDRLFSPRFAREYKRLPVSTVSLVYQAGHDIKGDRPEAFLAIVLDFLERGPTFVISRSSTLIHH